MDGVHPRRCVVCGMAVVCAAASPHCPACAARALPIPVQYSAVLLSCRVPCLAGCVVWVVCVCLRCSCGGVSSVHSPLTVVVGGAVVGGGVALCGGVA